MLDFCVSFFDEDVRGCDVHSRVAGTDVLRKYFIHELLARGCGELTEVGWAEVEDAVGSVSGFDGVFEVASKW